MRILAVLATVAVALLVGLLFSRAAPTHSGLLRGASRGVQGLALQERGRAKRQADRQVVTVVVASGPEVVLRASGPAPDYSPKLVPFELDPVDATTGALVACPRLDVFTDSLRESDGEFRDSIPDVGGGDPYLQAPPGYFYFGPLAWDCKRRPKAKLLRLVVPLYPEGRLDLSVVDEDGTPVPGATLTGFSIGAHSFDAHAGESDAWGRMTVRGFPSLPGQPFSVGVSGGDSQRGSLSSTWGTEAREARKLVLAAQRPEPVRTAPPVSSEELAPWPTLWGGLSTPTEQDPSRRAALSFDPPPQDDGPRTWDTVVTVLRPDGSAAHYAEVSVPDTNYARVLGGVQDLALYTDAHGEIVLPHLPGGPVTISAELGAWTGSKTLPGGADRLTLRLGGSAR